MSPMLEPGLAALQRILPHHALSRLVFWLMRCRYRPLKNALIRLLSRVFHINLEEAASANPDDYPHFNAFFTRALKDGARPLNTDPAVWVSPADGTLSEHGLLQQGQALQAKGRHYSFAALCGHAPWADAFHGGPFATIYLSPRDYHRVHMPCDGVLKETRYIPGRLFSVAPYTTRHIDRLFARNERLVCLFDTEHGPLVLVMVGAMLVSGIETVWEGVITPRVDKTPHTRRYSETGEKQVALKKGEELGRFNMGSTVILAGPDNLAESQWLKENGQPLRMGEGLLHIHTAS